MASRPRIATRLSTVGITCKLGDIVDVSETGARLRCKQKPALEPGNSLRLAIGTASHKIDIAARVVWVRRVGNSKDIHDVGIRFTSIEPATIEDIIELARFGFLRPKKGVDPSASATGAKPGTAGTAPGAGAGTDNSPSGHPAFDVEDLYRIFGVSRLASIEEIHDAFRRIARECHPDRNPSADATARFVHISKAYSVLKDPGQRARYDEMLRRSTSAA